MKKTILIPLAVILIASALFSHGLSLQFGQQPPFLWIKGLYEGNIPLAFGLITIQSPDGEEYQNGRSDRNGRFVFQPDRPGMWKITIDDEMGHQQSSEIIIGAETITKTLNPAGQSASPWTKWLLGVSLILLLTASLYIWKKR